MTKKERKQYNKEYREKNKEKINEYNREYYKKHREEKREYYRKYREENKEKIKEYKNKEKIKEYNKEYYKKYREENKEKINEYNKKYREKIRKKKSKSTTYYVLRSPGKEDLKFKKRRNAQLHSFIYHSDFPTYSIYKINIITKEELVESGENEVGEDDKIQALYKKEEEE